MSARTEDKQDRQGQDKKNAEEEDMDVESREEEGEEESTGTHQDRWAVCFVSCVRQHSVDVALSSTWRPNRVYLITYM